MAQKFCKKKKKTCQNAAATCVRHSHPKQVLLLLTDKITTIGF